MSRRDSAIAGLDSTVTPGSSEAQEGQLGRALQFAQRYGELLKEDSETPRSSDGYEQDLSLLLAAAIPSFATRCAIDLLDQSGELRTFSPDHDEATDVEIDSATKDAGFVAHQSELAEIRQKVLETQRSEVWPTNQAPQLPHYIVVGLRVNGTPFGTVTFEVDEGSPGFGLGEVIAAEQVALVVSSAVERVVLHRNAREALRRTQRIASQLHQLFAASISVAGLNNEHDILRRLASIARSVFDADQSIVSLERGAVAPLCGIALRNKSAFASVPKDTPGLNDIPVSRPKETSPWLDHEWLVAPILENRDVSRGVIAVERQSGADFSDEEREVLALLAQLASTTLGAVELSRTIERSQARWRVLVETAPVGIIEVDVEGCVRWWNRAAGRIFVWSDFADPLEEDAPTFPEAVRQSFQTLWSDAMHGTLTSSRDFIDVEISGRRRHLTASAAVLPSGDNEVRSLLTLVDDITDQRELKQELRHAHQMELRGQVASSVAHDFNNLLTLISGYAEMLAQNVRDDERSLSMVRDIQATASRASHLTAQLQAIGRTQSEESVILSPVTLIQSNAEVLERIVGVDIEIMWSLGSDVANIEVDADQFEQTMLNLAINARDAMPSGGRLSIAASNVTLGSTLAKDLGLAKGEYVTISVADTGVGMDEETRLRCFDPLFTTKGAFKGTGMGLAAARRLVEGSGGAIRCTSHPGEGAMFEILLPASREKATALAPVVQISRPRGSATVLVAEDDEELRSLMVQVLQRSGYVILEANSAESALELAKATDTPIDLLVSDVVMEELTGPQLARLLQDDQPGIRVLLISGTADANVVDGLIDDTAAFMAKPFKPSQLVDQVHDLLVRRGVR